MLYRFLRAINEWYGLAVFWVFVAAFIAALMFIFIFPFASLLLVFLGVFALLGAVIVGKALGASERGAARTSLRRNRCPRCGTSLQAIEDAGPRRCENCGEGFLDSGAKWESNQAVSDADESRADQPRT